MASSPSQLVVDLKQGGLNKFEKVSREFASDAELMTRKGVYSYSFMNGNDKFDISSIKNIGTPQTIDRLVSDFTSNNRPIGFRFHLKQ